MSHNTNTANTATARFPSHTLSRNDNTLFIEGISCAELAKTYGTPLYVYSNAAIATALYSWQSALSGCDARVHYSVKSNSNLSLMKSILSLGAGFDIVSGGELARALAVGAVGADIVFSGVGKTAAEMQAALAADVKCFNVESVTELERLSQVAHSMGKIAPVSLRVNPDVDAKTHPYISTGLKENKFGVPIADALSIYQYAAALPSLGLVGIDCHIGSQITEFSPFMDALDRILDTVEHIEAALKLAGTALTHPLHLDLGGGLGIQYDDQENAAPNPDAGAMLTPLLARIDARGHGHRALMFEPGRSIVGNAGTLLTTVEYLKPTEAKNFAIVDAAMNDLLRPSLYDAYHGMTEVVANRCAPQNYDIVGPVCESGDWLGKNRHLALQQGDVLAILSAGAYGMTMSSQYNTRPRAAEVWVDGDTHRLIKPRETVAEILASEITCLA